MINTVRHAVGTACLVAVGFSTAARAEYLIQPGDTLEVTVAGLPDLKHRGVVGPDGAMTVPMIQPLRIAGLDLAAAQKAVKEQLSRKLYQQRTPDGRESVTAIAPDAVTVTIAEYRPVYLNGDVTKPGAQAYLPGMTVRQAVALAGGYEIMRFRMQNPFLEAADLRNEYQTLWMRYVERQAAIWRLKAQLGAKGQTANLLEKMTEGPLSAESLAAVRSNAQQQLDLATDRLQSEKTFLQKAVKLADDQITLLRARQTKDDENVEVDTTDYAKLKEFSARGNLPMTRLSEARRLFLFSATQSLQTGVQLTNTQRERDEAQRKMGRLDEAARAEALTELEKAVAERDAVRSKLQAVGEKITYTGMIRSQLSRGGGATPQIRIIHPKVSASASEVATEDSLVLPGDTIEVALHTEVPGVSE
jgi:polysaccharide export outer membrane protein